MAERMYWIWSCGTVSSDHQCRMSASRSSSDMWVTPLREEAPHPEDRIAGLGVNTTDCT